MTAEQIIMGWKNPDYRAGDNVLPMSPAGAVELADPTLHPWGGSTPGSGRIGIRQYIIYSVQPVCSAYGDNLWRQEL